MLTTSDPIVSVLTNPTVARQTSHFAIEPWGSPFTAPSSSRILRIQNPSSIGPASVIASRCTETRIATQASFRILRCEERKETLNTPLPALYAAYLSRLRFASATVLREIEEKEAVNGSRQLTPPLMVIGKYSPGYVKNHENFGFKKLYKLQVSHSHPLHRSTRFQQRTVSVFFVRSSRRENEHQYAELSLFHPVL